MYGKNIYKGHRYTPKLMGVWNNSISYEGLSIVIWKGASYTSKQFVPVGVDINNELYWIVTGNYNAQVELYRQEVKRVQKNITENTINISNIATLTSYQFGIMGDGSDETMKLSKMINAIPYGGARLVFDKTKEITINGTSLINMVNKQNVIIEGLRATGTSLAVFQIKGGSKNITFRDCVFKNFAQVIYLFDCSEINIDNCSFDNTGYGIIQKYDYSSNNVKVVNCTAKNMRNDFIECNCTNTAPSKNWIIANNIFLGSSNYPNYATEKRFVGITSVENVVITGNIIERSCGDSAIHLEDSKGDVVISNNIFDNCVSNPTIGFSEYIFITSSAKSSIISGNVFKRTDVTIGVGRVLDLSNQNLTTSIMFVNNRIVGVNKNLIGVNFSSQTNIIISSNYFEENQIGVNISSSRNANINNNMFLNCNYGITSLFNISTLQISSSGFAGTDITISNNTFTGTLTKCITTSRNAIGTGSPTKWLIQGNHFDNISDGTDVVDFFVTGNTCEKDKLFNFGKTFYSGPTRLVEANNFINGVGIK